MLAEIERAPSLRDWLERYAQPLTVEEDPHFLTAVTIGRAGGLEAAAEFALDDAQTEP